MRIGQGFDVHAFEEGDHLIVGGVKIPYRYQFRAHSDGDVLLHALCDALLGAVALGDIGRHFPDSSAEWKGTDSRRLLTAVYAMVLQKGMQLVNADMTIIAQSPKMSSYISSMCQNIAEDLQVSDDMVSIKATTTESLGFTGRKEGIAASAIVLLNRRSKH